MAEARFYACKLAADGQFYDKKKEAEGLIAHGQAQGVYLRTLSDSLGGNYTAIRDFLMISGGMYQEIAKVNAQAVRGLAPKISIWTNGGEGVDGGGNNDNAAMKEVAGVYEMLPPLFDTVQEQTGVLPSSWMRTWPDKSPSASSSDLTSNSN